MPDDVQQPSNRHRSYSEAFDVVRPHQIYRARRNARNGSPGKLWSILDHYKTLNTEVRGAMQSVRAPVITEGIEVEQLEDSQEANRQRLVVEEALDRIGINTLMEDLLWGHYYGFRAHELDWATVTVEGTEYQAPVDAHRIPMEWVHARDSDLTDQASTLYVGRIPLSEYEPGSLIAYQDEQVSKYEEVDFTRMGCGTAVARFGVFCWYSFEDWAAYNEAWATPSVIGTLTQGFNDDDKELLKQAVNNLGNDLRAVKTDAGQIELQWPEGGDGATYDDLKRAAQKAIAVTIKSESLTDVDVDGGGSYAASRTTDGIRIGVADSLTNRVEEPVNTDIVAPIANMGWDTRLVRATIDVETAQDLVTQVRVDRELNKMGMALSISELRERYGRRPPEDDDDTLPGGSGGPNFDPLANA